MGWESSGVVRFDLGALLEGRMWSLIPIMVYISLIIGRRGLDVKTTYAKSCAPIFWGWFRFDLRPPPPLRSNVVLDTYNDLYLPYYWSHLIIWRFGMSRQLTGNHVPQFLWWGQI